MADAPVRVEVTDTFLARLDAIAAFLDEAGGSAAFDRLLDDLRSIVAANLSRFPKMGRRYVDLSPRSVEAIVALGALPLGGADVLREYLHGEFLILYALLDETVFLLTIRHHRELAYDFGRIWPAR